MQNAKVHVPKAVNEPVYSYAPGTPERIALKKRISELKSTEIEIPVIINGESIYTGNTVEMRIPHDHQHVLGVFHQAGEQEIKMAIESAMDAWKDWSCLPWESRTALFKRMASILQRPHEQTINAATVLGQSKNAFQAEVDASCELIDFFNFNAMYAQEIYAQQPLYSPDGIWNMVENRPLEGFIFAVTPFNFTSIAGNLPTAPALMGNVSLWKPASSSVYSGYFLMKLFEEAGLPKGVINFIPGSGREIGPSVLDSPHLAGVHFTGSTSVFQSMWKTIGDNISKYKTYPRIVGETGGKDFCIAHESANIDALATAMVRGAFEYQGQKCSAMSRAYIPSSIWPDVKEKYQSMVNEITVGDPENFSHFMNAVIDQPAFDSITSFIDYARDSTEAEIITGGTYDDSKGYFIEPTTIVTTDPHFKTMEEEIFGPVLSIYIYNPDKWNETLKLVDETSPYALTGCIHSTDREIIVEASKVLTHSAGNFYINDKPTGAVVGQQPFGGSRASGTNDKAGSMMNLLRWVSQRTIKETFDPPKNFPYPFMDKD
ncbi:MAG: L-glutamate gamma-semialdehyde dehydrogenase [Candidatus Marinimicrobia bacterium]|jgi:1-pyrroline-5-carboxylate dehydrogenase|nr:L-glutamate gamma-semialdehyde dehydrogenase [Candidatus Neomarinimicrobiota bacterium]MBT3500852.1 L-glutamate gamma-semialdehyde dehydrogenase [Candidatus Neomarinimicrobiota bacterium]MBT3838886.1 L-glutamate gamma-semialdehyde dehydrogenase [Candidatus Neomarinimicrobiota bacterium]MBT3998635.1 L-glutamate gamma-semialdehyde dehydrogenase [Candidatus Neomarinimicrobiota bacterium]MBT4282818.1 L-glutamate gamma-semialdehyde dehydrogenase [Candidatus Neomarinimicrobiota bacterium]